jgi:radical SAM protein with 4Fe4S-binding SPASM domain
MQHERRIIRSGWIRAVGGSAGDGPSDGTAAPDADAIGRRAGIRAGDGFAFVSHVGEVYPSGFLPESADNVREDDLVDVYRNTHLFESLRDPDGFRGKCGACPFRNVCGGSRSRAYAHTGDPLASDPLCSYVPDEYDGPLPWESPAEPTWPTDHVG